MCNNKKIVLICRNLYSGGAERVVSQLANYFCSVGVDTMIITIDNREIKYFLDKNIAVIPIGEKSNNKIKDKLVRYSILRKIIEKESPDRVLSLPEDIAVYVLLALFGTNNKVYVSERNNPWVMPDVKITRIIRRLMYPFAAGVIFQTEMAKSYFPKRIQKRGVVISNPIDEKRIPKAYKGERRKTIAAVGRLAEQKNFKLLIEAFSDFVKSNADYNLIIYGDGPLKDKLESLIDDLGIKDKVLLAGKTADVLEKINDCAMFVLSSDYEGMPNVLLEAMCMGMPVISTDCPSGGPKTLIKNEKNGILVSVNNKCELIAALNKMTDLDYASKCAEEAYKLRDVLTSKEIFEQWKTFIFNS